MLRIRLRIEAKEWKEVLRRLKAAYTNGDLRLVRRIQVLLAALDGVSFKDIAEREGLSEQSVRNYVNNYILKRLDSLEYRRPPGRPARLTKTERKELGELIEAGPEASGYDNGGWDTILIQDLIKKRYGVSYNLHYIAELLNNMGFSWQRARFVSGHLGEVEKEREKWMKETWPAILKEAKKKKAKLFFGDEVSFAQWGSLSYTWARKGKQPVVKTSGKRRGYKIFGLIEYFSGAFLYKGHTKGRFNSESYAEFLLEVLKKTKGHLIIIQDGASYHTSKAMKEFFKKHAARLTMYRLPSYSPEFNPIEFLWRNIKKQATHLRYFPTFEDLTKKVDQKLRRFADAPASIRNLMGRYCETLGAETATA